MASRPKRISDWARLVLDKAAAKRAIELRVEELAGPPCPGLECSVRVEVGQVVPTILHALDEMEADLLVIGAHPSRGCWIG